MATIVESIAGDRALQLGNEEFVRPLGIGNLWTKIRISIRWRINTNTAAAGWQFRLGICRGLDGRYTSNTSNWIGGTWPLNGNTPLWDGNVFYYSSGSSVACYITRKINTTVTNINGSSGNRSAVAGLAPNIYSFHCVEFWRSGGDQTQYGVRWNLADQGPARTACSQYDFYRTVEDENLGTAPSTSFEAIGGGPYYQTGLSEVMDHVSLVWNQNSPTIDIASLNVIRFY